MKMGSGDIDLFGEGSLVEVSSAADGFPGVWYTARVLERSPGTGSGASSTSSTKNEMVFLVEFQKLYSNGSTKLTKPVNFKFIRPLPPTPPPPPDNGDQTFEVNDVVEAYLADGWWEGEVFEVLEEQRGYSVLLKNPSDLINFRPSNMRLHLDWVDDKWVQPQNQLKQQKEVETSNQKREGGKPSKSLLTGKECDGDVVEDCTTNGIELSTTSEPSGKECNGAEGDVDKMVVEDCTTIGVELATTGEPTETATEPSDSVSKAKNTGMDIISSNNVDVDEPTSCFTTIVVDSSICGRTINQSSEPKQKSNEVVQYDSGAAMIDNMPYEDEKLRSLESSPVMRFIQSMDVFQSMPQEPHFRPLAECEEVKQEGLAVGHMMTFVNVVKKTSKLQVNAPRCNFDSLFQCLPELELHGFDVKAVRRRLLELQSMKENQEQLKTKSEKIKSEIMEQTHERNKVKAELDDVMNDLKVLKDMKKEVEEKKTGLISMNNENDLEISKLISSIDPISEEIQKVKAKFKSLAASPWK